MKLDKLYTMQEKLDKTILDNEKMRTGEEIDKNLLLNQTILALQVEVAELANATRCFKHWSIKGPESKERLLDEYADILHFFLSIGNQMDMQAKEMSIPKALFKISKKHIMDIIVVLSYHINDLYTETTAILIRKPKTISLYSSILRAIEELGAYLKFTTEEVEQAYMEKHKENYRRQEEGY
jgi:dimeric dUTPase (all-alpha-NTP-PPase superfamily)